MIFTADINDSGEYVCEAKNEYESVQITLGCFIRVVRSLLC